MKRPAGIVSAAAFFEHIPGTQQVHYAQRTVIQAVAGAALFAPNMPSVVGADITGITAVVICFHNVEDSGVTVAVAVGCFAEIAVIKMLYIADVGERNAITAAADNFSNIILRIGTQRARTQAQAVIRMIYHFQEALDCCTVNQQTRQSENIPGGIVLVSHSFSLVTGA